MRDDIFSDEENEESTQNLQEKANSREPAGFKKLVTREQREKLERDYGFDPPALGKYNPKLKKLSKKIWRDYDTELKDKDPFKARNKRRQQKSKFTYDDLMRNTGQNLRRNRSEMSSMSVRFRSAKKRPKSKKGLARGSNWSRSQKHLGGYGKKSKLRCSSASNVCSRSEKDLFIKQKEKNLGPKKNYFGRFPNRPVSAYIHMSKRPKRRKLNEQEVYDKVGKQFEYLEIPKVSSRYRPIESFKMKKKLGRKGNIFGTWKGDQLDYKPNYEVGKKRINSGVLSMETITARKPPGKPSLTPNEALYDYDRFKESNKSMLLRKVRLVNFEKNLPRELDPESGLPSFLQTRKPVRPMTAGPVVGVKG
jgi:hypothetical protein